MGYGEVSGVATPLSLAVGNFQLPVMGCGDERWWGDPRSKSGMGFKLPVCQKWGVKTEGVAEILLSLAERRRVENFQVSTGP